jgi:hypothetical protein
MGEEFSHDTYLVGVFSTKERAMNWCRENRDFAGKDDYWVWTLMSIELDNTENCGTPEHFEPNWMLKCAPNGTLLEAVPEDKFEEEETWKEKLKDVLEKLEEIVDEL